MKELNDQDRYALASKLEHILGADLDPDEEDAIEQAIRLISPEYAAMRDAEEQEAADWFDSTTPEQRREFVDGMEKQYPAPSPDRSGTPAVPPVFNGKVLRFGNEEKKK